MTFLTVMQALAKNAGVTVPTTTGQADPDSVKFREFINEAGKEIARRVDWRGMRRVATITGDSTAAAKTIDADFARLARGLNVIADGEPVRGSLTSDEWFALDPEEGKPRYFYLEGDTIAFWPYLETGQTAKVQYLCHCWCSNGSDAMVADGDTAVFNERLLELGSLWRWRRHVGKDYSDNLAEFEAALADYAAFDGGVRQP